MWVQNHRDHLNISRPEKISFSFDNPDQACCKRCQNYYCAVVAKKQKENFPPFIIARPGSKNENGEQQIEIDGKKVQRHCDKYNNQNDSDFLE
jgi:hypothetical protein